MMGSLSWIAFSYSSIALYVNWFHKEVFRTLLQKDVESLIPERNAKFEPSFVLSLRFCVVSDPFMFFSNNKRQPANYKDLVTSQYITA